MADAATVSPPMTADEFFSEFQSERAELIDGEVVTLAPAGEEHAGVAMRIMAYATVHADSNALGTTYDSSLGVVIGHDPDTVLEPDGAFVAGLSGRPSRRFLDRVPDLVLEVVSPTDRPSGVVEGVQRWLGAGAKVVWVADPGTCVVTIWRSAGEAQTLGREDVLTCDDLLPGFALPLSRVFRQA